VTDAEVLTASHRLPFRSMPFAPSRISGATIFSDDLNAQAVTIRFHVLHYDAAATTATASSSTMPPHAPPPGAGAAASAAHGLPTVITVTTYQPASAVFQHALEGWTALHVVRRRAGGEVAR